MLVYGDPQLFVHRHLLVERALERAGAAQAHDDVRSLLILAGQLEQAIGDRARSASSEPVKQAMRVTDAAARWFIDSWKGREPVPGRRMVISALEALRQDEPGELRVKVPEGFAFYTLFPEQYGVSARLWSERQRAGTKRSVLVIGLRSIGTTLSAVVAEALRDCGWNVRRITVRPDGPPSARTVDLDSESIRAAEAFIVVDEGPGQSGSSMAAVFFALRRLGFGPERVTLFPAHAQEPGPAASPEVRQCWATVQRVVTPLTHLEWRGKSLLQQLERRSCELLGKDPIAILDLSAGAWRRAAYPAEDEWPSVDGPFERTKYLIRLDGGSGVLWKFEGFIGPLTPGTAIEGAPAHHRVRPPTQIMSMQVIDHCLGFAAYRWVDGTRLHRTVVTRDFIEQFSDYIAAASAGGLSGSEREEATARLGRMLLWNARESLGESAGARAKKMGEAAMRWPMDSTLRCYGDGRLAPHEFVQGASALLKTDWCGHDCDHTIIGRQPVWWDVAGAMVEWNLSTDQREILLRRNWGADRPPPDMLQYYCAAYAAFRIGVMSFAAAGHSTEERIRTERASRYYRTALWRELEWSNAALPSTVAPISSGEAINRPWE